MFTQALYYLVPNFHNFNAISAAAHGEPIPFSLIWQNTPTPRCTSPSF